MDKGVDKSGKDTDKGRLSVDGCREGSDYVTCQIIKRTHSASPLLPPTHTQTYVRKGREGSGGGKGVLVTLV